MARTTNAKQRARREVRELLWPGAELTMWPQPGETGWSRTPRTLPLIAEMISSKAVSGEDTDLARTYLTLFCMAYDEGIIEIVDEDALALASGLKRKSWIARMLKLQSLGVIEIKPKGPRRLGYVLLKHPVPIARRLHAEGKVSEGLWALFLQWHAEFGGTEPNPLAAEIASAFGSESTATPNAPTATSPEPSP